MRAGLPLLEAARRGFAAEGFTSGTVNIRGGALGPLGYVMPALSRTGENAAFYSDVFRPAGVTRLKMAAMTFGKRGRRAIFSLPMASGAKPTGAAMRAYDAR